MTFQRLSHLGICVSDFEKSLAFYTGVLGFSQISKLEIPNSELTNTLLQLPNVHLQAVFLERDGIRIELLHFKSPGHEAIDVKKMNQTGLTHLSFRVKNLDQAIKAIEEAGGKLLQGSITDNPKFMMRSCFMLDMNNVRLELLEAPGDPDLLPGQRPQSK